MVRTSSRHVCCAQSDHVRGAHSGRRLCRMWQLSANIHRNDVPQLDRAEQIAEWMELSGLKAQLEPLPHKRGRPDQGINAAFLEPGKSTGHPVMNEDRHQHSHQDAAERHSKAGESSGLCIQS